MDNQQWLEVSISVQNGELAEAVAEILSRYVENGVVTEREAIHAEGYDIGVPVGAYRVFGYLDMDGNLEQTRQQINQAIWHLNLIQPVPEPDYKIIANQNWMEAWKKNFHPIPIGQKLMIIPSWVENPEPERISIAIDPNMAFGTGTHPTTQLCMLLLEKYALPGQPLIDMGCGSGILSIAAIKLGMGPVVAVDVEQDSVNATMDNATANGVAESISVGKGSVTHILAGEYPIKPASLMTVNILAPIILRLFDDGLTQLVKPGGFILFSGIMNELEEEFVAKAKVQNLELLEQIQQGDWLAYAMRVR